MATTFKTYEESKRWIQEGYRMMDLGSVLTMGTDRVKEIYAEFREEFPNKS